MDRSAPTYYVAVRRPNEKAPTQTATAVTDPPDRPPKARLSQNVRVAAVNAAIPPFASAVQALANGQLRSMAVKVLQEAQAAANSKSTDKANSASSLAVALLGIVKTKGLEESSKDAVNLFIITTATLQASLVLGTSKGGRRRGDKGVRRKPSTPPVDVSHLVTNIKFEDNERKVDRVTLTVDNFNVDQFDDPLFKRGNTIEYTLGYAGGLAPIREAVIRKVTGGIQLTVEAHSKDVIMDRIKRRQRYKESTRSDVVRIVADRNGYSAEQLVIEDTVERYEVLVQPNLTDAQFLRKLANKEGFEFYVDYDGFHWHRRNVDQAPIRKLVYYTDPGGGDVLSWSSETDLTRRPARVRVRGINPETGEEVMAEASDTTDTDRDVLQPTPVTEDLILIDGVTAATTFTERTISQPVAHEEDVTTVAVDTQEQAEVEAKKRYRKAQQRAVKMTLTMIGDPTIVGKSVILLEGWGKRLDGRYYIQNAVHTIAAGGTYTLVLKLITDGFGSSRRRGGGGAGASRAPNGLEVALERLLLAARASGNDKIRKEVEKAVSRIRKKADPNLDKGKAEASATIALRLISTVQVLGEGATGVEKDGGKAVVHAAGGLAGVCKRIAQQDPEKEAEGRLNDKEAQDAPPVDKIAIDPNGSSLFGFL